MIRQFNYEEAKKRVKSLDDVLGPNGLLQGMLKDTVQEMLEAEATHHLGFSKHNPERRPLDNYRNGSSQKMVKTSQGNIDLAIPRDRNGTFEPQIVRKYETTANELEDRIISMYAKGMTTRDIGEHLRELYGVEASPTLISQITNKVLELVQEWQARPLETVYPIVYLDALHFKVRDQGKVITKAAYIVLGIDQSGKKDILGIWISQSEGANFWAGVLTDLRNRGVEDILIACVDGLKGFPEAIAALFPRTEVQKCVIHQIRNSLRYVASKHQKEFIVDLKKVYRAPTKEQAEAERLNLEAKWGQKYSLATKSWVDNWEPLSQYFKYPPEIRKLIYTTNPIEGFNRQLRKITKNRSLFPADDALRKLLWLGTNDIVKKWTMPVPNWAQIISQLAIYFPKRLILNA